MRLKKYGLLLLCLVWSRTPVASQTPTNLRELGQREYRAGHYVEAESYFRTSLESALLADVDRAGILSDLGAVLLDEERLSEAKEALTKSLAILKRKEEKQATAVVLQHLGAVYSIERHDEEAIALLNRALKAAQTPPTRSELTAQIFNCLGIAYFRQGRVKKAEQLFQQGLQALATPEAYEAHAGSLLNNLGAVYTQQRKYPLAEELLTKSLRLTIAELGPVHPAVTDTLDGLGVVYARVGRYAEAEAQFQRSVAILEQSGLSKSDTRVARSLKGLADTYIRADRKADAAIVLERAVLVARRNLRHPDMINILDTYSRLLGDLGKPREAKEIRSEVQRARVMMAVTVPAFDRN